MKIEYTFTDDTIDAADAFLAGCFGREIPSVDIPLQVVGAGNHTCDAFPHDNVAGIRRGDDRKDFDLRHDGDRRRAARLLLKQMKKYEKYDDVGARASAANSAASLEYDGDTLYVTIDGRRGSIHDVWAELFKVCEEYGERVSYETSSPWLPPEKTTLEAIHRLVALLDLTGFRADTRDGAARELRDRLDAAIQSGDFALPTRKALCRRSGRENRSEVQS